jgi:uncharacterized protein YndB with AHSA1/START domain
MAEINHEIKIHAPLKKTFKALCDFNELKCWHTAHIEEKTNGDRVLIFKGTGRPTFLWKIVESEPNKTVSWECLEGPGDSAGTKAIYKLSETDDTRTLVELSHTAWPDQEGNFRKCNTLWGILMHHLKNYLETGKTDPAIL